MLLYVALGISVAFFVCLRNYKYQFMSADIWLLISIAWDLPIGIYLN